MHRCNLTAVLLPNYSDIPALLAKHDVEVIASLPYFQARETDAQRGAGVFDESIETLRRLNALGYGHGTGLVLTLVANPVGTFLPGDQAQLAELEAAVDRAMPAGQPPRPMGHCHGQGQPGQSVAEQRQAAGDHRTGRAAVDHTGSVTGPRRRPQRPYP